MSGSKGILGDTPVDYSEGQQGQRSSESIPSIKLRVIASYVILTALSAYVIYDYRIRPDCICRPRPYVFAITAFGITGLYGIMGILNRTIPSQKWLYEMQEGMDVLVFSVVLPYLAVEMWVMNRFFSHIKYIPYILQCIGYPAVDYYYFFHKQLFPLIEGVLITLTVTVFAFMAVSTNIKYFIATALFMYAAYFSYLRYDKLPLPECWTMCAGTTKQETMNYALSACILCASISML